MVDDGQHEKNVQGKEKGGVLSGLSMHAINPATYEIVRVLSSYRDIASLFEVPPFARAIAESGV